MKTMDEKQQAEDRIMRYLHGVERMRKFWGRKAGYLATHRGMTPTGYTRAEEAMFERFVKGVM